MLWSLRYGMMQLYASLVHFGIICLVEGGLEEQCLKNVMTMIWTH